MGVILATGVHGVGKTSCCEKAAKLVRAPHYTASEIIRAEKATAVSVSKHVRDVTGNQELLIKGVRNILNSEEKNIFLDGHFSLLNEQGHIELLNPGVFQRLCVDGVVIFLDDPRAIQARLQKRDNREWNLHLLAAHQDAELQHAKDVTSLLRVPLLQLAAFDSSGLVEAARNLWGSDIRAT